MKLIWLTDIHLNFVDEATTADLCQAVQDAEPGAVLIGGDIAESDDFARYLQRLARCTPAPVYFVLGNHDYYRSSIRAVRNAAAALNAPGADITWLPRAGFVQLTPRTTLTGHGGWGDGRAGGFLRSSVILNDYVLIEELRQSHNAAGSGSIITRRLLEKLHALGDETAEHFRTVLPAALEASEHVIVLMHVPPFHRACWHNGQLSDDDWAPHFVCQAAGEVLEEMMEQNPTRNMTVLCGHTHGGGEAQIRDNLRVLTGPAVYGQPGLQPPLIVD